MICWLMSWGFDTRVTRIATATDSKSAGICATNPSPMVRSAYVRPASETDMPCCAAPMMMPPNRLMKTINMPAMASPRTNLLAPSIAP
jgi:hypothetical protein